MSSLSYAQYAEKGLAGMQPAEVLSSDARLIIGIQSTYTFSNIDFGPNVADKILVIGHGVRSTDIGDVQIDDGVFRSADFLGSVRAVTSGAHIRGRFNAFENVATTTGTVRVTNLNAGGDICGVTVHAISPSSIASLVDTGTNGHWTTSSPSTLTVNASVLDKSLSVAFGFYMGGNGQGGGYTWLNGVDELSDQSAFSDRGISGAAREMVADGTNVITGRSVPHGGGGSMAHLLCTIRSDPL